MVYFNGFLLLVFNNRFKCCWGVKTTDSDGHARITLPISFSGTWTYSCVGMHRGSGTGICFENSGYRNASWIPIIIENKDGSRGGGWTVQYICIGY